MSNVRSLQSLPEKFFDENSIGYLTALRTAFFEQRLSGTSLSVATYEEQLKEWFGTEYALPVASGSAAIFLALHAMGVRRGDKIIVSALAPIPTLLPILLVGAEPLFVDVTLGSFQFDMADVKKAMGEKPRALLAVALWGYPVLTDDLVSLLADSGVPLIEDSAHAHGSVELGKLSGTLGKVGCFSTHDNKLLSTGEGGFALTDCERLYKSMRNYSHLGYCKGATMGFNFKLGAPQALLGQDRLTRLNSQISARETVAKKIVAGLSLPHTVTQINFEPNSRPNFYNLGFFINAERSRAVRLIRYCHRNGLLSNTIKYNIKPSYMYPLFSNFIRPCINAEMMTYNITSIPCSPNLTDMQIGTISTLFNEAVTRFV